MERVTLTQSHRGAILEWVDLTSRRVSMKPCSRGMGQRLTVAVRTA